MSKRGWRVFEPEAGVTKWAAHALGAAIPLSQDARSARDGLRCGGTWFVGANLLPNDAQGRLAAGPPLDGAALAYLRGAGLMAPLDRAQISVIYPGYPRQGAGESDASFAFRRDRDAAHVDGLLPVGASRRRHLHEPHGFVLGVPLNASAASPMVVWEGSHEVMRAAFAKRLAGIDPALWAQQDLTDTYHAARKTCFQTCRRTEIRAQVGQAYWVHRLALHGVAPWGPQDSAPPEGRIIAYFRPQLANTGAWLA